MEEGQTSNWTKENGQTVKQCSSKHYPENDWATRIRQTKPGMKLGVPDEISIG